ncbi:hypothetical protein C2E23DRAFT_893477 [Lenzites betulinus]|nr:hypothetical protein C2E23DRAFT_893477 [Lenzites betulinus]
MSGGAERPRTRGREQSQAAEGQRSRRELVLLGRQEREIVPAVRVPRAWRESAPSRGPGLSASEPPRAKLASRSSGSRVLRYLDSIGVGSARSGPGEDIDVGGGGPGVGCLTAHRYRNARGTCCSTRRAKAKANSRKRGRRERMIASFDQGASRESKPDVDVCSRSGNGERSDSIYKCPTSVAPTALGLSSENPPMDDVHFVTALVLDGWITAAYMGAFAIGLTAGSQLGWNGWGAGDSRLGGAATQASRGECTEAGAQNSRATSVEADAQRDYDDVHTHREVEGAFAYLAGGS